MPTPPPKGRAFRRRALADYNRTLSKVHRLFGHRNETSSVELQQMLKRLGLTPSEVGPKDMMERRKETQKKKGKWRGTGKNAPKYGIYNTAYKPPGEHWVCCYDDYTYDPLGDDASGSQEQPDDTDDCGQRCVAYLLLCRGRGSHVEL